MWRITAVAIAFSGSAPALAVRCDVLRTMSFNIRLDVASDGDNSWERRRNEFVGQVELMRPDILGLQEVVPGQKRDLEAAMPSYQFLGVARDDGRDSGEYSSLAVLRDRFKVRSSGTFWISETPDRPSKGWDAAYPRVVTWARLVRKGQGTRILAINTHLDHSGAAARLQGARQIAAFIAAHRRPSEAVIVTGDFNATPESPPIKALQEAPASLRDSRTGGRAPAIGPEGTFNGFNPLPAEPKRIDYVFHDASLQTLRNATLAWHGEGRKVASDHFAVVADLADAKCRP